MKWNCILKVRNTILIEWVCIVECVDEAAFQCDHLIQIIYHDAQGGLKTVYLQAKVDWPIDLSQYLLKRQYYRYDQGMESVIHQWVQ